MISDGLDILPVVSVLPYFGGLDCFWAFSAVCHASKKACLDARSALIIDKLSARLSSIGTEELRQNLYRPEAEQWEWCRRTHRLLFGAHRHGHSEGPLQDVLRSALARLQGVERHAWFDWNLITGWLFAAALACGTPTEFETEYWPFDLGFFLLLECDVAEQAGCAPTLTWVRRLCAAGAMDVDKGFWESASRNQRDWHSAAKFQRRVWREGRGRLRREMCLGKIAESRIQGAEQRRALFQAAQELLILHCSEPMLMSRLQPPGWGVLAKLLMLAAEEPAKVRQRWAATCFSALCGWKEKFCFHYWRQRQPRVVDENGETVSDDSFEVDYTRVRQLVNTNWQRAVEWALSEAIHLAQSASSRNNHLLQWSFVLGAAAQVKLELLCDARALLGETVVCAILTQALVTECSMSGRPRTDWLQGWIKAGANPNATVSAASIGCADDDDMPPLSALGWLMANAVTAQWKRTALLPDLLVQLEVVDEDPYKATRAAALMVLPQQEHLHDPVAAASYRTEEDKAAVMRWAAELAEARQRTHVKRRRRAAAVCAWQHVSGTG